VIPLRLRRRIELRGRATIGKGVRIAVARGARVVLEDGAVLGDGCRIEANGGTVRIGPRARLGERAVIVAHEGVDVGAGCLVGDWAMIADAEPTYDDPERPTRLQPLRAAPVTIGEGARIGVHAAVKTSVGAGVVVEPYAVTESAGEGGDAGPRPS
jgi:acetyltransferase-like isoleucine patch superfamily enzyme